MLSRPGTLAACSDRCWRKDGGDGTIPELPEEVWPQENQAGQVISP